MPIEFKDSAEAIVAIATVIISADKVGNFSEKDRLFSEIRKLEVFQGYDAPKFNLLLGNITQKTYDLLPNKDGVLTQQGFEDLVAAAKKALNTEMQKETFKLAVALAVSDGLAEEEARLLDELQTGFNIDLQYLKQVQMDCGWSDNPSLGEKAA